MSTVIETPANEAPDVTVAKPGIGKRLLHNPSVLIGAAMLLLIALMGVLAPLLSAIDPAEIDPSNRNKVPGYESTVRDDDGNKVQRTAVMGTDSLGRDIYTRVVWGARVSLTIGLAVAALSVGIGLFIGLVAGYFRALDGVVMRVMDGLMAVPGDPGGDRAGLPVRRQPDDGDRRGGHSGDSARGATGALDRAVDPRRTLCRSRHLGGHARLPAAVASLCCPTPSRR